MRSFTHSSLIYLSIFHIAIQEILIETLLCTRCWRYSSQYNRCDSLMELIIY